MPPSSSQPSLTPSPLTEMTPPASPPNNPSMSTPTKAPLSLTPGEDSDDEGFPHFSFGAPRGHSQSSLQTHNQTPTSSRLPSNPNPNLSISVPPNGTSLPSLGLPVTFDAMPSTSGDRSHSPSPDRDALTRHGSLSPHLASPWWGKPTELSRPWKDSPKRKQTVPPEQTEGWELTRTRVARAAKSVLGTTGDVTHELLELSVDLLELAPIPGLRMAAKTLLNIWDAVERVDMNRLGCLRLTDRCAEILLSVRQEISDAGDAVGRELAVPIARLEQSFADIHTFLQRQIDRPFLKRYLKRDEIIKEMERRDDDLRHAVGMFKLSIQTRILKQVFESERQRVSENQQRLSENEQRTREIQQIMTTIRHPSNSLLLSEERDTHSPTTSLVFSGERSSDTVTQLGATVTATSTFKSSPTLPVTVLNPSEILSKLESYHRKQNSIDAESDLKDFRQVMSTALQATSDAQMLKVLQIGRPEMPEAIKTLQRALERLIEKERVAVWEGEGQGTSCVTPVVEEPPRGVTLGKVAGRASVKGDGTARRLQTILNLESPSTSPANRTRSPGTGIKRKDTLDREFIESGIDALRRLSRGMETNLPTWTITKYEVDLESRIGVGFFSDVYEGTWRGRTVAVKVLADSTPRKLFVREIEIWKGLRHVNVLPLCGASSASGKAPWFFVSPYLKNGSLVEFLKRVERDLLGGGRGVAAGRNSTIPAFGAGTFALLGHWSGTLPAARMGGILREWDLFRFMYEIANGMEYLHSKEVLHGDLKAANVLVDDEFHCVISDFGQSEMKSEVFRISGTPPPRGTVRWQAPELLSGQSWLTAEMDVYAFAICCLEILNMGRMPWPLLEGDAVSHLVLKEDSRPSLHYHDLWLTTTGIQELLRVCWHQDPKFRPPFFEIVQNIKELRRSTGHVGLESPQIQLLPLPEDNEPYFPSPDMRPSDLPDVTLESHPSTEITYRTPLSHVTHQQATFMSNRVAGGELVTKTTSGPSGPSPIFLPPLDGSFEDGDDIVMDNYDGYHLPPLVNKRIAAMNERQYRISLRHLYHPSLTLPLWSPSPVDVGAVGYLSKERPGRFMTLFNAFSPQKSDHERVRKLPSMHGYGEDGRVKVGSQRQGKRSGLQQRLDAVTGSFSELLTIKRKGDMVPQNVSRGYTYPLKADNSIAILCAEKTEYQYFDQLDAPKRWFQGNVDSIVDVYGMMRGIQREDLFLVVGTLSAAKYALFVSHSHPDGHAHFSVYSSPQAGQPWGTFTTDAEVTHEGGGPFYDEPSDIPNQSASKVSYQGGGLWGTVLLARLRFKPDHLVCTSK